jgi:uncharacterized protein
MPVEYKVPGVYIEEIPPGSRPIAGVATAMPVFIGFTRVRPEGNIGQPVFVASWNQYVEKFCSWQEPAKDKEGNLIVRNGAIVYDTKSEPFVAGFYLSHAVYGYFMNGGQSCYILSIKTLADADPLFLSGVGTLTIPALTGAPVLELKTKPDQKKDIRQLQIVIEDPIVPKPSSGAAGGPKAAKDKDGKDAEEATAGAGGPAEAGDQTLAAPPDAFNMVIRWGSEKEEYQNISLGKSRGTRSVAEALKQSKLVDLNLPSTQTSIEMRPKSATYDRPHYSFTQRIADSTAFAGSLAERTGISGLEEVTDATMIVCPDLMSSYMRTDKTEEDRLVLAGLQKTLLTHCALMKDRFAILDAPPDLDPEAVRDYRLKTANFDTDTGKYGALYYPWIHINNPAPTNGDRILKIPPSGHLAGIYARVDAERGVHKAPANEAVRGALKLERRLIDSEQGILNPEGINCIREFPGRGILVWGARTLAEESSEWRYINVRRLFNFVEESIFEGTQWVVFEPNDMDLWERVKRTITAFLTRVWQSGALFGATPEQAFYVKCDAELNTPAVRDAGQLIVEIGIAPVKPAEFVVFRFKQIPGGEGGVEE